MSTAQRAKIQMFLNKYVVAEEKNEEGQTVYQIYSVRPEFKTYTSLLEAIEFISVLENNSWCKTDDLVKESAKQ